MASGVADRHGVITGPRIIVALDYPVAEDAIAFAARVSPAQCRLKIGMELFTAAGPRIVTELVDKGFDVFLDLKYHDIPTTVAKACSAAASLGVWMLNVHTLGGRNMLQSARAAIDDSERHPLLIGVTVLTSHSGADLEEIGMQQEAAEQVERLAVLAHIARLDGVVCSARETAMLRTRFGVNFALVTPGIRPEGSSVDDQQRVLTPCAALEQGSDYLVIGRPITRAPNPREMLEKIEKGIGNCIKIA